MQTAPELHESRDPQTALKAYRTSLDTINKELLPAAQALNEANSQKLDEDYNREKSLSKIYSGGVLVVGLVLITALIITQAFLFIRFRRRINPPIFIATILSFVLVLHLYSELSESAEDMKVAKEYSFDSILTLLDTRASAYSANAAEIRWLLDRQNAGAHEKEFNDHINSIVTFAPGHDFASTIDLAEDQLTTNKFKLPGLTGTLASEFHNVSFEAEKYAVYKALLALRDFCAIDKQMRALENAGNHEAAMKLGLGYHPEASKFPFTRLDDSLGTALKTNLDHFDQAVIAAEKDLNGLALLSEMFTIYVILSIYFGLRPRMAEYL